MARPSTKDPLDKFRWSVSIDGFTRLGFATCSVPSHSIRTKSYPEGGGHLTPRQIVDSIEYKPVSLTRGVTTDKSFLRWAEQFQDLVWGNTATAPDGEFTLGATSSNRADKSPTEYRRDVIIKHIDRAGRTVRTYELRNAFPIEYKPASDFAADGDDTYSMETLVLAYESYKVDNIDQDSNPFSIKDISKRLIRRVF